jgi:hypothetical protein
MEEISSIGDWGATGVKLLFGPGEAWSLQFLPRFSEREGSLYDSCVAGREG